MRVTNPLRAVSLSAFVLVFSHSMVADQATLPQEPRQQPPPVVDKSVPTTDSARTEPMLRKDGWWIRIDQVANKATRVQFEFAAPRPVAPNDDKVTARWFERDPLEFDLPTRFRKEQTLLIKARADGSAALCVYYKDQAVSRLEFHSEVEREVTQTQRAPKCNRRTGGPDDGAGIERYDGRLMREPCP